MLYMQTNAGRFSLQAGPRKAVVYSYMLKLSWKPDARHASRTVVFIDDPFVRHLWSKNHLHNAAPVICAIMEQRCPQVWSANQLRNSSDCIRRFAEVPQYDPECGPGNPYAEGYSQACRHLHASFALLDDSHCAHISFKPQADYLNRTKCQRSTCIKPEALFTDEEINVTYAQFKKDFGIPVEDGFAECSCDTDYSVWYSALGHWVESFMGITIVSTVTAFLDAWGVLRLPRLPADPCSMCYAAGKSDAATIVAKRSADELLGPSAYCTGGASCWWRQS